MTKNQDDGKISLLAAVTSSVICLLLYLPVLRCGFVNYDDPEYVLNNPVIRQLDIDSLSQMFFQSHVGWWMPLTWMTLAIDYHFWSLNAVGYHLTNILLHSANAGIVVLIADRMLKSQERSADELQGMDSEGRAVGLLYPAILLLTGMFFGAHPLRVESVAWITERKDVLNGLFAFLSVLFYLHFVEQKERGISGKRAGIFYAISLLCFVCSLMAKSVSVVLPAMLIVLDWVPLGRFQKNSLRQLIMEKWPFFTASILITLCTFFFAAKSNYLVTYESFPFMQRVVVSGNAIWEYANLLLFPV
ncbi:MAG: hypothetical protein WCI45_09290, partial [Desulfuromonadales bacterium]